VDKVRFPGESAAYRAAREALTKAELDLTRQVEKVAALRRALPPGGVVPQDYTFAEGPDDLAAEGPIRQVRNLRLLSSAGSNYDHDYHGENADGDQISRMNVFTRDGTEIRHFWASEQSAPPGQDTRHVDLIWPLWNLLDLTPGGRGDWRPSYSPKRRSDNAPSSA
jgi:predicted dithiol-disulfide oxidoreductase (DUF899 family)